MANDIADNRLMFDILKRARKERTKTIALCMGEHGQISRILGGCFGSFLTYSPLTENTTTAPGQLTLEQLRDIFRVTEINSKTAIFGLVGKPVKYSRGMLYHNARFAEQSANAVYVNFLVDTLPSFVEAIVPIIRGFSVTMPYKREIIPFVRPFDAEIKGLGAINTVIKQGKQLVGYNTDYAALKEIVNGAVSLRGKKVLILGTGSMSRTMVFTCIRGNASVTIAGRSAEKARALAKEFGCEWSELKTLPPRPDVVMNGTSVGMGPSSGPGLLPPGYFHPEMLVVEAVYNPPETAMVQEARRNGAKVITGLEIFEHQAAMQSKLFREAI
jgi:3-dehydroquinate dehydratase / shikimate dehydrogenase